MALEAQLNPLNVPSGTEFPGTVQGLLQLIAEYMEITGLSDFNGVNYGSVEPDPADRDKAWLRTTGGGEFLGWYVWTGAAWTILPSKAYVGTEVERDALASPQEGWMFHVVGTGLSTYTGSEWEWGFPAANEDLVGDKNYFFPSHQLLISASAAQTAWTDIDLTTFIATSGVPAENITAAIIRLDAQIGPTGQGGATVYTMSVRCWGNESISTGATDILNVGVVAVRDTSSAAANNTITGYVPMSGGQTEIFYNIQQTANPPGIVAAVWLVGFIYTPSLT